MKIPATPKELVLLWNKIHPNPNTHPHTSGTGRPRGRPRGRKKSYADWYTHNKEKRTAYMRTWRDKNRNHYINYQRDYGRKKHVQTCV